ncbi:MAG: hypothetical protein IKD81_07495 [Eubacteriaceae bacterium]|nr:hypothetical protein [Eubacteriaceae bacterium]
MKPKCTIIVLFLALIILFSSGCRSEQEEFSLIGSWTYMRDLTEEELQINQDSQSSVYKAISGIVYIYKFEEDGTYSEEWHYIDKYGNLVTGSEEDTLGDEYEGTYTLDGDQLTLTEINPYIQISYVYELKPEGTSFMTWTPVMVNDKPYTKKTDPIRFERIND